MNKKRWAFILLGGLFGILLLSLIGFVIWAETPLGPMPEALAALETDNVVRVEQGPWLTFWPQEQTSSSGVIIYPGGRVDPRSYAPTARAIAEAGYLAVITPMPLNLAVFDATAAADVIAAYPEIDSWVLGGHSLGGAMAATFVEGDEGTVDGLLFWAAYPPNAALAASTDMAITSVYATNDGLATLEDIDASRANLPADTQWTEIKGGNHAQFGWYGEQPGDGKATISRADQQDQIVTATIDLLEELMPQTIN